MNYSVIDIVLGIVYLYFYWYTKLWL